MSNKLPACRGFRLWATQEDIDKLEARRILRGALSSFSEPHRLKDSRKMAA